VLLHERSAQFLSLRGYFGTFDDAVLRGILILIMLFSRKGSSAPTCGAWLKRALGERLSAF